MYVCGTFLLQVCARRGRQAQGWFSTSKKYHRIHNSILCNDEQCKTIYTMRKESETPQSSAAGTKGFIIKDSEGIRLMVC
jgi:hypothetical protein